MKLVKKIKKIVTGNAGQNEYEVTSHWNDGSSTVTREPYTNVLRNSNVTVQQNHSHGDHGTDSFNKSQPVAITERGKPQVIRQVIQNPPIQHYENYTRCNANNINPSHSNMSISNETHYTSYINNKNYSSLSRSQDEAAPPE